MDHFICTNVYIPLRSSPSHRSEMVSQILYGERFKIVDSSGTWLRIETLFDSYRGWIDGFHGGYEEHIVSGDSIITGREVKCCKYDGSHMILAPGSELSGISSDLSSFSAGREQLHIVTGNTNDLAPAASVSATALQYLHTPYMWGGRTPWGIDCSGLVQVVFKIHGHVLPRDASEQSERGETINFLSDALPGDVVFFSDESEKVTHTGILLSESTIIHASGSVRCDMIDHQGIWRDDHGIYTHRLRVIKRIIQ